MAKKKVKSDFEDMKNKIDESFEFDDEDFGDIEEKKQQLSRNKNTGHKIFFIAVGDTHTQTSSAQGGRRPSDMCDKSSYMEQGTAYPYRSQ